MITKDNIKVARVKSFIEKNGFKELIPHELSLDEAFREVVVIDGLVIDIKTSTIIEPLKNNPNIEPFNYYYDTIINLQYVSDIDFASGISAYQEYNNQIKKKSKIINIKNIKSNKNKRHCN